MRVPGRYRYGVVGGRPWGSGERSAGSEDLAQQAGLAAPGFLAGAAWPWAAAAVLPNWSRLAPKICWKQGGASAHDKLAGDAFRRRLDTEQCNLILQLLVWDPALRLSAEQAAKHAALCDGLSPGQSSTAEAKGSTQAATGHVSLAPGAPFGGSVPTTSGTSARQSPWTVVSAKGSAEDSTQGRSARLVSRRSPQAGKDLAQLSALVAGSPAAESGHVHAPEGCEWSGNGGVRACIRRLASLRRLRKGRHSALICLEPPLAGFQHCAQCKCEAASCPKGRLKRSHTARLSGRWCRGHSREYDKTVPGMYVNAHGWWREGKNWSSWELRTLARQAWLLNTMLPCDLAAF